jgi:CheY-specific phosphatase CheX
MSNEFLNSFLVPAQQVWQKALKTDLLLWKTGTEVLDKSPSQLTSVVEVVGAIQGTVLYSLDGPSMRAIVRKMIEHRSLAADLSPSHMSQDALSDAAFLQISQMITDEAVKLLKKSGSSCMVSSARLVKPKGTELGSAGGGQLLVAFRSNLGNLKVRIHEDLLKAKAA